MLKGCVATGAEFLDVIKISIPNICVNYMVTLKFINFYCCTVHSDICKVHSPTNALLLI